MAMEISNAYSSYVSNSAYATKGNNQEQIVSSNETDKISSDTNASTRKTAADELSYLSEKYDKFCFIAANYTKGMGYGTNSTTNIAISPAFLKKMANDPEMEKEYESYFGGMQALDAENIRSHEARGRHIVAQGWAIDKDGGISRWGISEPTNKRHYGQEMNDYANKIRERKADKEKEQEKIEEKRKESKEKQEFGNKFKGSEMEYRMTTESEGMKANATITGSNFDIKL